MTTPERKCETCAKRTKLGYGLLFCKEKGLIVPTGNSCKGWKGERKCK